MPLIAPGPFTSPPFRPGPGGVWDPADQQIAAGLPVLIAHTTTLTPLIAQVSSTGGVTVTQGVLDHNLRLLDGDLLVLVMVDTAAGATATFLPSSNGVEGNTSGVYQGTTWNASSSNTDLPVFSSTAPELVSVWSTLVKVPGGGQAVTVQGTFAGTTGTRRMFLYLVRPRVGQTIPYRGLRLVGQGTLANAAPGGAITYSVPVTWTYSKVRTTGVAMIVVGAATGGSTAMTVDADNDSTFELANDDIIVTSTFLVSQGYPDLTLHRPGTTVALHYPTNPSVNVNGVLIYGTQQDPFPSAVLKAAYKINTAKPKGGRNAAPAVNLNTGLAMKAHAFPRSKFFPPVNHLTGLAMKMSAKPRYVKHATSHLPLAIDMVAAPWKPPTYFHPDQQIPPGFFTGPGNTVFTIPPAFISSLISFLISDSDTATGTDNASGLGMTTGETGAGAESAAIRTAAADTAAGTDSSIVGVSGSDAAAGTELQAFAVLAVDLGTGTEAVTIAVALTAAEAAAAADNQSVFQAGGNAALIWCGPATRWHAHAGTSRWTVRPSTRWWTKVGPARWRAAWTLRWRVRPGDISSH
jgi:hypothetical protein